MEKTYLNDLEVVNELINVVPVATTEKNEFSKDNFMWSYWNNRNGNSGICWDN